MVQIYFRVEAADLAKAKQCLDVELLSRGIKITQSLDLFVLSGSGYSGHYKLKDGFVEITIINKPLRVDYRDLMAKLKEVISI